jgi:ubiquinone/menaquinone biosynthesis C-methylase UbiE
MASRQNVWDNLASKYDNLWVQKYSLAPTRAKIRALLRKSTEAPFSLLDLGCGTAQLLEELADEFPQSKLCGADKSEEMLKLAESKNIRAEFVRLNTDDTRLDGVFPEKSFDCVVCCHSFPYYADKFSVLEQIRAILKDEGEAIFIQACVNNLYDSIVMELVEKTAESAEYLSRGEFRLVTSPYFTIKEEFQIKMRFFMPSICGFVLGKRL